MELILSILVLLSVAGCTLSAPLTVLIASSSTQATTLSLQPPAENNLLGAAAVDTTPATTNDSSSASEQESPRVAFVIPTEPKTNNREKKSTSSGTCPTVNEPHKPSFMLCNDGVLPAGYQGGDSSSGYLSGGGSIRGSSSLSNFGDPSHFNSGASLNAFSHGDKSGLHIEAGGGVPSHTILSAQAIPQAIHPQNFPFGPYGGVSGYGLPREYQGLPISGAFGLSGQGIGFLPYEQIGEGYPIEFYKTSDSTKMLNVEEISTPQKDIQVEIEKQQAETKMRDAAALEEANMSLFRSGGGDGGGGFSLTPVPVIDNFLPTIPLSNGQQLRGVFPNDPDSADVVGGGRCGSIPLLLSCSPRLVSGSLVGANGYGSGVYGASGAYGGYGAAYYGDGYQFSPWFSGVFGGGYRQENAHLATSSPIPLKNAGAKKMEKPEQNTLKGGIEKKIEPSIMLPKD